MTKQRKKPTTPKPVKAWEARAVVDGDKWHWVFDTEAEAWDWIEYRDKHGRARYGPEKVIKVRVSPITPKRRKRK